MRILSLYLYPFMPKTASAMAAQLGLDPEKIFSAGALKQEVRWGGLKKGTTVQKGSALFPRIDPADSKKQKSAGDAQAVQAGPTAGGKGQIGIEDFKRLDLRVGKVLEAERVAGSEKLLRLTVDLGREQRQIVAGMAKKYSPEELIHRKVVVLANLAPAKLMGVESQGMILAAGDKEVQGLATFLEDIPPGTVIR